ncbi:MAG TPA: nucleoside 2-deoxyribosyltransferase [Hyphomicrobiaceae bacterium]|nr:nucleoside 2-deoxyribosyltransferase [Hyphomicrobiaceae bacterium]
MADVPDRKRPRVYLAGPEVFLPDPMAAGRAKVALCAAAGLDGLFPLDAALDLSGLDKHRQARSIAMANEGLMRSADCIIANLTPFRGVSMDSGTAFEVGFMRALGRPVFGYTNVVEDFAVRARAYRAGARIAGDCDRADIEVEDFDLAENLMITEAIGASGGGLVRRAGRHDALLEDLTAFEKSVEAVAAYFEVRPSQA